MSERVQALGFVLLVVVAGCSAVPLGPDDAVDEETSSRSPTAAPGGTASVEDEVDVEGGTLPVNASLLFARVEGLAGEDVEPNDVEVRDLSDDRATSVSRTPIHGLLGIGQIALNASRPAGLTSSSGLVVFDPAGADSAFVERRLVHEFVHVVQFRSGMVRPIGSIDDDPSTDRYMAWLAISEGSAVWLTDIYVDRYMPGARNHSAVMSEEYESADPAGNRLQLGPYFFGHRYVRAKLDSARELESLYDDIPRTTEQLIHRLDDEQERPMSLSTDVSVGGSWEQFSEDRAGELFLRVALRAELSRERAAEAAAGWGTDQWLVFEDDGSDRWGLAWVTRWDSPAEAEEFASALSDYVDRRRAATDGSFDVVELGEDTVVLLAGDDAFVDAAEVSGDDGDVSVTVDDSSPRTTFDAAGPRSARLPTAG
jgi:hypothetical protein